MYFLLKLLSACVIGMFGGFGVAHAGMHMSPKHWPLRTKVLLTILYILIWTWAVWF